MTIRFPHVPCTRATATDSSPTRSGWIRSVTSSLGAELRRGKTSEGSSIECSGFHRMIRRSGRSRQSGVTMLAA